MRKNRQDLRRLRRRNRKKQRSVFFKKSNPGNFKRLTSRGRKKLNNLREMKYNAGSVKSRGRRRSSGRSRLGSSVKGSKNRPKRLKHPLHLQLHLLRRELILTWW